MADLKISQLTAISVLTPATDVLPVVDVGGVTKKITTNQILASGGVASLASATITGDLTVDTSTLKVDSTNNRVGIGTASPGNALHVQSSGDVARFTNGTNNAYLAIDSAGYTFFTGAGQTGNGLYAKATTNAVQLWTNGAQRYDIDSTGISTWSVAGSTAMTLNSTVLAMGVTPNTWTSYKALQVNSASIWSTTANDTAYASNVYYDGAYKFRSASSDKACMYIQFGGSHQWHYTAAAGTAGNTATFTQAMTLDASGNFLIGVTSASNQERLNVSSAVSLYVARVFNTASSGGNYGIAIRYSNAAPNNGSNEFLACSDSAASRAFIYSNGGIANYQANDSNLSDARTKTDIKPLASYWNKIKALELVTFKYKDQTHDDDNIGLIAQQVESVAPEFVSNEGFGETPADGVPLKTIYSTDLYHAAIKALQEAMTRIEVLESKLA